MTASTMEPPTVPAAAGVTAGDVLLARLLPAAKRPAKPKDVREAVSRFFRERLSDERWQETIDGLVHAGLVTTRPLRLTDAGRARALEFLGVAELPSRSNWKTVQVKYLLPKALGLPPGDPETAKQTGEEDRLAALLLRRRFALNGRTGARAGAVIEAIVCRELGFPDTDTLADVRAAVLSRLSGLDEPLNWQDMKDHENQLLLGVKKKGIDALRESVFHGWTDGPMLRPVPAEFDLEAFARTVRAAARDCPTGRYGENKVFIAHVWRRLRDEPGFPTMDLATFKRRLTEANNAGLLTLSRADLIEVMDPEDVRESEARYLNAEFHFVLLEKEQP